MLTRLTDMFVTVCLDIEDFSVKQVSAFGICLCRGLVIHSFKQFI